MGGESALLFSSTRQFRSLPSLCSVNGFVRTVRDQQGWKLQPWQRNTASADLLGFFDGVAGQYFLFYRPLGLTGAVECHYRARRNTGNSSVEYSFRKYVVGHVGNLI